MAPGGARNGTLTRMSRPRTALLHAVAFIDGFGVAMVIPLLPMLSAAAGANPGEWVLIVTLNGVLLTLGSFAWARVVTPSRAWAVIGVTLAVKAVCLMALCWQPSWTALIFNRGVSGIMVGTPVAVQTVLMDAAGGDVRRRAAFISSFSVVTGLGLTMGPLAAMLVLEEITSTAVVMAVAGMATLSLAGMAAMLAGNRLRAPSAAAEVSKPAGAGREHYSREVLALLATSGLSRCATTAFPVLLLLAAEAGDRGLAVSYAAFLIALIGLVEIGAQLASPLAAGRMKPLTVNSILLVLITAGLAIAAFSMAPATATAAAVVVALGGGAIRTTITAWMVGRHGGNVGRLLGDNLGVNGIARSVAPVAAGMAFSVGAKPALIAFAAIPILLIALLAAATRPRTPLPVKNQPEE